MRKPEETDGAIAGRVLALAAYVLFLTLGAMSAIADRGDPVTPDRVLAMLMCSFN